MELNQTEFDFTFDQAWEFSDIGFLTTAQATETQRAPDNIPCALTS
jgi:hypothetical protein